MAQLTSQLISPLQQIYVTNPAGLIPAVTPKPRPIESFQQQLFLQSYELTALTNSENTVKFYNRYTLIATLAHIALILSSSPLFRFSYLHRNSNYNFSICFQYYNVYICTNYNFKLTYLNLLRSLNSTGHKSEILYLHSSLSRVTYRPYSHQFLLNPN